MMSNETNDTGFNPARYFINLKGREYLPVAARVAWLRSVHPNWTIENEFIRLDFEEGLAFAKSTLKDETGRAIADGYKVEERAHFPDFVEKAETGAVGRALALAGFGTLHAQEYDEGISAQTGEARIADSPAPPKQKPQPLPNPSAIKWMNKQVRIEAPLPADPAMAEAKKRWKEAVLETRGRLDVDEQRALINTLLGRPLKDTSPIGVAGYENATDRLLAATEADKHGTEDEMLEDPFSEENQGK